MQRLEGDKDSLQMQVSILMDQIDAQQDKIADLERGLADRAYQLQRAEENLQKVSFAGCLENQPIKSYILSIKAMENQ